MKQKNTLQCTARVKGFESGQQKIILYRVSLSAVA